jgi:hypothetical protein
MAAARVGAQERPYFVTYNDQLEEPGNLEIDVNPTLAAGQHGVAPFASAWIELEYGVRAWWTSELYLDGQATRGQGSLLTGYRWENRVRPLRREHAVNPVLYLEYESLNEADKTLLEVVGHDVASDHAVDNRLARRQSKHELETKLILTSRPRDWDVSLNLIAEKNLAGPPWEFGYAFGLSRPLALAAAPQPCAFCAENFAVGLELYGGLGDANGFGLRDTSHYAGPALAWSLPNGVTFRLSPSFGLNGNSQHFLLRLGASYELPSMCAGHDAPGRSR